MKKMSLIRIAVASTVIMCVSILGSCVERDLLERSKLQIDGILKIYFEWPNNAEVKGARLLLYRSDGTLYDDVKCMSQVYECKVPADTYTALVANIDCVNAGYEETETAVDCCVNADRHPTEEGVLQQVAHIYSIGQENIKVKAEKEITTVTLAPKNRVKNLLFDVNPINITNIRSMRLRMTGIIPSIYVADGSDTGAETKQVLTNVELNADGHYIGSMSVLGWRSENLITAEITYEDERFEISLPSNIEDQLAALPEEGGIIYLTLEFPSGGKVTIVVTVEIWETGTGSGIIS